MTEPQGTQIFGQKAIPVVSLKVFLDEISSWIGRLIFLSNQVKARIEQEDWLPSPHGLPWWLRWYTNYLQCRRPRFDPWVGKIPWRRKWLPTPVFLPGEFHGQRSIGSQKKVGHDWATFTSLSPQKGSFSCPVTLSGLRPMFLRLKHWLFLGLQLADDRSGDLSASIIIWANSIYIKHNVYEYGIGSHAIEIRIDIPLILFLQKILLLSSTICQQLLLIS